VTHVSIARIMRRTWRLARSVAGSASNPRHSTVQQAADALQSWLATAESVIGIVIEGVFVAMSIQRLFR
jgi:hypothetical protein